MRKIVILDAYVACSGGLSWKELEEFGKFKKGIQGDILRREYLFMVSMSKILIFNI